MRSIILLCCATGTFAADPTISVDGRVTINAIPDGVCWQVVITTTGADTSTSRADNDRATTAALAALTTAGLPATAATQSLYSQQQAWRTDGSNTHVMDGWTTERTLTITLTDLAQYQQVSDSIVSSADVSIRSMNFTVHNETALRAEARTEALHAARVKAQAMAEALGAALGKPVMISENQYGSQDQYLMTGNATFYSGGVTASTPPLAGRIPIIASVNVSFALIDPPAK